MSSVCVVLHAWFIKVDRIIKRSGSLIGQRDIGILVTLKHKEEIFCWRKGKAITVQEKMV